MVDNLTKGIALIGSGILMLGILYAIEVPLLEIPLKPGGMISITGIIIGIPILINGIKEEKQFKKRLENESC